jgi:hypothetical protein
MDKGINMNAFTELPPSTEQVLALVRGELSSGRRWFYRGVLVAASTGLAVILSLWTTEPRPLPLRLQVAFAGLSLIGASWVCVLSWILSRRYCPTALDRIATGWVATGACTLFLVMAVGIADMRNRVGEAKWAAILGLFMLSIAVGILGRAYRERSRLRKRLAEFATLTDGRV